MEKLKVELVDELDTGIEVKCAEIDTTELYEKHKAERNKRQFEKFKKQQELHREIIEEIRY